jgi:NADP-dependent 3-hydroxy acid dehydrogenase YdfG
MSNNVDCKTVITTGASSGLREATARLLSAHGASVALGVRRVDRISALAKTLTASGGRAPAAPTDVTDSNQVRKLVEAAVQSYGRIDVMISNAGYGLVGAAEELTESQIDHMIATNLVGSIQLIRAVLLPFRALGSGRIIQISAYGGQVAFAGNSMYHATKWGIEGFVGSVAQEVASFGIGMAIVEPGGARTEFRYGSAQVADLMPIYDDTPAHSFQRMLDPKNGLAPGDPARMAARIIEMC